MQMLAIAVMGELQRLLSHYENKGLTKSGTAITGGIAEMESSIGEKFQLQIRIETEPSKFLSENEIRESASFSNSSN